jgi:hypothetical protein
MSTALCWFGPSGRVSLKAMERDDVIPKFTGPSCRRTRVNDGMRFLTDFCPMYNGMLPRIDSGNGAIRSEAFANPLGDQSTRNGKVDTRRTASF